MSRWRVLLLGCLASAGCLDSAPVDYSKEAAVLETSKTVVHFSSDGTSDTTYTIRVKIQSEGVARQFGVLSLTYSSGEKMEFLYVRVRKPDGKIIETSPSDVMDVASEVARVAPMYSDLHQQQLPVKGLAVGDTLEFSSRNVRLTPEVPNQYWFTFNFDRDSVVLSEDLDVYAPSGRAPEVVSPGFKPAISDEGAMRHYAWHYEQLEPTPQTPDKTPHSVLPNPPDIQITTFRSWDELGAWYAGLVAPQAEVTPAIAAKAAELTKGLTTPEAKARALYEYVAMRYRYISISFGIGRYRPHKAEEVLQNGYGDCKDKHTLLLALLKASGIRASTVLIGSGLAFDREVPSPAQFNHVIMALPMNGHTDWLDTTAEVAPYGMLVRQIRDHDALAIDPGGNSSVERTPADPPFSSSEVVSVDAVLDKDGLLIGHFDMTFRGDSELLVRALFLETAPAQWPDMAQNLSKSMSFGGDVSNVTIDNVRDLEKPLHLSYDYKRTNYSDWAEHKMIPPLPPLALAYGGPNVEKPADDIDLPSPGKIEFRAVVRLPKEYRLEPQKAHQATSPFASYRSTYEVKDGKLTVDRVLETTKSKVPLAAWDEYRKVSNAMYDDHNEWMNLVAAEATPAVPNNPEAAALLAKAGSELNSQEILAARANLDKAKQIAPQQVGLYLGFAVLAMEEGHFEQAAVDVKKEIEFHPENVNAYRTAMSIIEGQQKDYAGAISIVQTELKQFPHQPDALATLGGLYGKTERWGDLVALLDAESKQDGGLGPALQAEYAAGLLHTDRKSEGLALARKIDTETTNPLLLNDVAWGLVETEADLELARQCAEHALRQLHTELQPVDLDHFETADLMKYGLLSATWDTAAWIYYKTGNLSRAEEYAKAAWRLSPRGDVADHLGQILAKQGKAAEAATVWRIGLALDPQSKSMRDRLKTAAPVAGKRGPMSLSPNDELNSLRTIPLKDLQRDSGTAEYFLLFSRGKLLDQRLVGGGEGFGSEVDGALRRLTYFMNPPGDDTKIIRKGILSCSAYTSPKCQIVLLRVEDSHK